jgi:hypothetical protein
VRSRLTTVVVPVVGLLAVTTALALVGIAPIVLFPASKEAGPRPIPPSASTEVASVTAPPAARKGGSDVNGPANSPSLSRGTNSTGSEPAANPSPAGEDGGTISRPQQPGGDEPDEVARHDNGSEDKAESKGKEKKGKALGHSKDKAKGKAKGHAKWQGEAPVAFAPRAAKPGHVHPAPPRQHSGGSHRPHARPRG